MDDLATKAVDAYVAELEEERVPDGFWHPSSISSPCARAAVMSKQGKEPSNPPDERTKRVFRIGHTFHKFVQDAIAKMDGILIAIPEIEVECPVEGIKGTADMLNMYSPNTGYELVEIKSIKDAGLNYAIPKPEHVIQTGIYGHCLREHGGSAADGTEIFPIGGNLKRIRYVYVGKETMTIREKVVDYTLELEEKAMKRLRSLQMYEQLGELPRAIDEKHWFRNYCQFKGSGMCCADKEKRYPGI